MRTMVQSEKELPQCEAVALIDEEGNPESNLIRDESEKPGAKSFPPEEGPQTSSSNPAGWTDRLPKLLRRLWVSGWEALISCCFGWEALISCCFDYKAVIKSKISGREQPGKTKGIPLEPRERAKWIGGWYSDRRAE
jgi:hypothetical protein